MRISDWSSDVCSSDLLRAYLLGHLAEGAAERRVRGLVGRRLRGGRLVAAASAEQDKAGEEKNDVWLGHAGCPHGCVMIVESRKERPACGCRFTAGAGLSAFGLRYVAGQGGTDRLVAGLVERRAPPIGRAHV